MAYTPPPGRPVSTPPSEPGHPVRKDGESHHAFGRRVLACKMASDPEFAAKVNASRTRAILARTRKERRLAKAKCAELNATETRGVWRTTLEEPTQHRRDMAIERRAVAGRTAIYLIPHDAPPPLSLVEIAPPERPQSLLSRLLGWFR